MNVPCQSLDKICKCWKGQLNPSSFASLQWGIEVERNRLKGKKLVLLARCVELNYDGLWEDIKLVEGFTEALLAIKCTHQYAQAVVGRALAEPTVTGLPWQLVDPNKHNCHNHKSRNYTEKIQNTCIEQFELLIPGHGYARKFYEFELVEVGVPEVVGSDIFCFMEAEMEWIRYLTNLSKTESYPDKLSPDVPPFYNLTATWL